MVFVLLALFLGQFGSGVYDLVFSNFLRDAQHLDVEMRGFIELPRELPGILSLFVVGMLFMFNEVRMAGVACLLMFGGMYGAGPVRSRNRAVGFVRVDSDGEPGPARSDGDDRYHRDSYGAAREP